MDMRQSTARRQNNELQRRRIKVKGFGSKCYAGKKQYERVKQSEECRYDEATSHTNHTIPPYPVPFVFRALLPVLSQVP